MPQVQKTNYPRSKALIALGSNVTSRHGTPKQILNKSLNLLSSLPLTLTARSAFYETPFFPAGREPDVINAVIEVETDLEPDALLSLLHRIEADMDRERTSRWSSRTLDLDLLTMDQKILPDQYTMMQWVNLSLIEQKKTAPDQLILPHPRLQDRAFVLVPAAEIAPDWRHPVLGLTLKELRDNLPAEQRAEVRRLPAET